ncbi:MAG: DUF6562 domain-containing protein [Rikenellaceae bacterium]
MKRYFLYIAVVILALACQNNGSSVLDEDLVTLSLDLSYRVDVESRAESEDVALRYVVEAYVVGEDNCFERQISTSSSVDLSLLKGLSYDVLVWADYVSVSGDGFSDNMYYDTSEGLKKVATTGEGRADNSAVSLADAFSGVCTTEVLESDFSFDVYLSRPLAKLEVYNSAEVTCSGMITSVYAAPYEVYNVLTGEVSVASEDEYVTRTYSFEYSESSGGELLYEDYFFVEESGEGELQFLISYTSGSDNINALNSLMGVSPLLSEGREVVVEIRRNVITKVTGSIIND